MSYSGREMVAKETGRATLPYTSPETHTHTATLLRPPRTMVVGTYAPIVPCTRGLILGFSLQSMQRVLPSQIEFDSCS